ncbi:MAG TPA: homoserine kinase, partial [Bacteroidota bacterium]
GIEIDIDKGLPIGSGIGSSAASAVAAAVAADALLDARLSAEEILECSVEGEKIASGAVHVDNLAPSFYGGFILVRGYNPIDVVRIKPPESLWCTIIYPHIEIMTIEARKLLPQAVPLRDLITQTGNAAGLVAGLLTGDLALIGRSLNDVVAEPARAHLIPGFHDMKRAALSAGALGCSISGAGPSLFALSASTKTAQAVGEAMSNVLRLIGCRHSHLVSAICKTGARLTMPGSLDETNAPMDASSHIRSVA